MTAEVAEALAQTLTGQPRLRSLVLNDISLTDEGVAPILEALVEGAPQLEELEMALNEMTAEGAKASDATSDTPPTPPSPPHPIRVKFSAEVCNLDVPCRWPPSCFVS